MRVSNQPRHGLAQLAGQADRLNSADFRITCLLTLSCHAKPSGYLGALDISANAISDQEIFLPGYLSWRFDLLALVLQTGQERYVGIGYDPIELVSSPASGLSKSPNPRQNGETRRYVLLPVILNVVGSSVLSDFMKMAHSDCSSPAVSGMIF